MFVDGKLVPDPTLEELNTSLEYHIKEGLIRDNIPESKLPPNAFLKYSQYVHFDECNGCCVHDPVLFIKPPICDELLQNALKTVYIKYNLAIGAF